MKCECGFADIWWFLFLFFQRWQFSRHLTSYFSEVGLKGTSWTNIIIQTQLCCSTLQANNECYILSFLSLMKSNRGFACCVRICPCPCPCASPCESLRIRWRVWGSYKRGDILIKHWLHCCCAIKTFPPFSVLISLLSCWALEMEIWRYIHLHWSLTVKGNYYVT